MRKLLILVGLVLSMLLVSTVFADGGVPSVKNVDFQGAKLVSEGGYFYIEITNNRETVANLTFYAPILFEERPYPYYYSMGHDAYYVNLILEPHNVTRFHFHAPSIEGETQQLRFYIEDNEAQIGGGNGDFVSYLLVTVVQLDSDFTFNKSKELGWLKYQNKQLQEQLDEAKSQISPQITPNKTSNITNFSLALVFIGICVCAFGLSMWYRKGVRQ